MTAEPYIIFQNAKNLSVESALEKMEKFMSKFTSDSTSAILSKDRRMSRPSDDSIEKLKTTISSLKDQSEFHQAEVKKLQLNSKKRRQLKQREVVPSFHYAIEASSPLIDDTAASGAISNQNKNKNKKKLKR